MKVEIISLSQAKAQLLKLVRLINEEGRTYVLTKDGKPEAALISFDDYDSIMETLEILDSPDTLKDIREAFEDYKQDRIYERDKKGKWVKAKRRPPAA